MTTTLSKKIDRMIAGDSVIVSECEYDELCELEDERLDKMVSVYNKQRVGILDALVAYIKLEGRDND